MKTNLIILTATLLVAATAKAQTNPAHAVPPTIKTPVKQSNAGTADANAIINIAAVGDIMMGTSYPAEKSLPPDSGKNSFKAVIKYLKGNDITFGNLEGTLLDKGLPAHYKMHLKTKAYLFKSPVYYGKILKDAGFNLVSLANNHASDFGETGRRSTVNALDKYGIHYGGLEEHPTAEFTIKGVRYGFCAFAPNAHTLPILDLRNAGKIIKELKQRCDIVIVSFHGGGEGAKFEHINRKGESYFGEKRGDVYAFAHNAIRHGADMVFGNGPHVTRAMELYKGRLIAYSLGNFCTYKSVSIEGVCGIAPLLNLQVKKNGEFVGGKIISIRQDHERGIEEDRLNQATNKVIQLTKADFPESGLEISPTGVILPAKS
jgi:poly-gamma-glutamate capsule biosynthesis protein CapA/YwtB (metallophosphatase superfamily)